MKISEPSDAELEQSASLPGRRLARDVFLLPAAQALVGTIDHEIQELVRLHRIAGKPVVEGILDRVLDDFLRRRGRQAILGLALKFGFADEYRQHATGADHDVFAGHGRGALFLADARGVILQPAQERGAQAGFVSAAIGSRDRVAIRLQEAIGVGSPGDCPLDGAVAAGLADIAGEDVRMHQRGAGQIAGEIIFQAVGEMEYSLLRHVVVAGEHLVAVPANLDAAEKIGL
jgi:hypothetical protein